MNDTHAEKKHTAKHSAGADSLTRQIATGTVTVRGHVLTHTARQRERGADDESPLMSKYLRWAQLAIAFRAHIAESEQAEPEPEPTLNKTALNFAGQRQVATGIVFRRGNVLTHISNTSGLFNIGGPSRQKGSGEQGGRKNGSGKKGSAKDASGSA